MSPSVVGCFRCLVAAIDEGRNFLTETIAPVVFVVDGVSLCHEHAVNEATRTLGLS